ncbi:MAG: HAD family phosphatase [Acidobacteriota bacterium]|nr:MAG: HAD family phosphatase [Acidobacteriota bacterium]
MYEVVIFDLDGTLVQTEKLKAISYARAAYELSPETLTEAEVVEAFKEVVGRSRQEVAQYLVERFELTDKAREQMEDLGVATPWQAYVQVRLRIYEDMIRDPEVLRTHRWEHNLILLEQVRLAECRTGLATMSHCDQAKRVLKALSLERAFDFVATRDDVEFPKPDPEIYLLVAREMGVAPEECLVIEDSPAGVTAAKNAGMAVIAVTTPFTREAFRSGTLLDRSYVVDQPNELPEVVRLRLAEHRRGSGSATRDVTE